MRNPLLLLVITFFLVPWQLLAQKSAPCISVVNTERIMKHDPARYKRMMALEQSTRAYVDSVEKARAAGRLINQNGTIVIPVVVHVLHRGEAIGVGRNITDAQIQSQIDVLNEDFNRLNADAVNTPAPFQPVAGAANIEFRLACVDPTGNPTNGITRTFAGQTQFDPWSNTNSAGDINEVATGIKFTATGGRDAWPTGRYLNIWVCELNNGVMGYAQFPDQYATKQTTDGIVVMFDAFGRVGNLQWNFTTGRVAVHEVGHWLNLRHIWGDANCGNDFVNDTPVQQGPNSLACPAFPQITCANGPDGGMFMNFMDYTDGACMNLFTQGQATRMRAVFAQRFGPRSMFIDNYFHITPPASAFCTDGNLSIFNPTCLPVTWQVLSGPAQITAGQNTNTVSIQKTGNGVAVIRASAGNYFDDQEIVLGPQPPVIVGPYHPTQHLIMAYMCTESPYYFIASDNEAATYTWTFFPPVQYTTMFPKMFAGSPVYNTEDSMGLYTVRLEKSTAACGSVVVETVVSVQECLGEYYRLSVYPTPASSQITVSIDKENNEVKSLGQDANIRFELFNFNTGLKNKEWIFKNKQSQFTLNLTGLNKGVYILKATKGKYEQTIKVMVN